MRHHPKKAVSNRDAEVFLQKHLDPNYQQKQGNKIVTLQQKNDIIAMLLDGKESKEIRHYLMHKYNLTANSANVYIQKGKEELKSRKNLEVSNIINLHLHRYEEIFKKLKAMGANTYCLDVMKQKEKLLQFHREGFHMKVSKGEIQSIQLEMAENEYNLENKLSIEEQNRLEELLAKARKDGSDKN